MEKTNDLMEQNEESKIKIKNVKEKVSNLEVQEALSYLNYLKENYNIKIDKLVTTYEKKQAKMIEELNRLEKMMVYENLAYQHNFNIVCGIDEAGRGPLAGPVVAAAVILPKGKKIIGVNDSKKLSAKKREELYDIIIKEAVAYGVGIVDEKIIDQINILNATKRAMTIAVESLKVKPECLFIDNEKLENIKIKQKAIVKGDTVSISIAAASIIAKVTRDRMMDKLNEIYPSYGFIKHKGYGTKEHINAIKEFGLCPIHRISFSKKFSTYNAHGQ